MTTRSGASYTTNDMSNTGAATRAADEQNLANQEDLENVENEVVVDQEELQPEDDVANAETRLDPLRLHYMVQQQQLELLQEQRSVMELNVRETRALHVVARRR